MTFLTWMHTLTTNGRLSRCRNALTLSALLLVSAAIGAANSGGGPASLSRASQTPPAAGSDTPQGPQPPCGNDPIPSYPSLDGPAVVKAWSASDLGGDWVPPACTGWNMAGFTTLVTIAAQFRFEAGADGLLRRLGAISRLEGVGYWSTTHKRWQTLIVEAHALSEQRNGSPGTDKRADFTPDDMKPGAVLYFEQTDNLSGKAVYRMHIAEASPNRIVIDIENVSEMRYFLLPVIPPGETQSIYFLDRESDSLWGYYGIVRIGKHANRMIAGNEKSSINRAVAFYRHLVGIPTDQEPPAAR